MTAELDFIAQKISGAKSAEDFFGPLSDAKAIKETYRYCAKIVHPDKYVDSVEKSEAEDAFKHLNDLWELAQKKIQNGTYGGKFNPITLTSRKKSYELLDIIREADVCNIYMCDNSVRVRVPRQPTDNDLMKNEAQVLKELRKKDEFSDYFPYIPEVLDTFSIKEDRTVRQINVLQYVDDLHSLAEVKVWYTAGIDPKDMAWMFRRLLVGLGFIHKAGYVHGAILPENILLQLQDHGLVLDDWLYSTDGPPIKAIVKPYGDWYPKEVREKKTPKPGIDIAMAARCMLYVSKPMPVPLERFLNGCIKGKPNDAWELLEEFNQLIEGLWGPRKFRVFPMPI